MAEDQAGQSRGECGSAGTAFNSQEEKKETLIHFCWAQRLKAEPSFFPNPWRPLWIYPKGMGGGIISLFLSPSAIIVSLKRCLPRLRAGQLRGDG